MDIKTTTSVTKADTANVTVARKKRIAQDVTSATVNSALLMNTYAGDIFGEVDLCHLIDSLSDSMAEVHAGDMKRVEGMLFGQAHALQSIFLNLADRAATQQQMKHCETYLRLALKAQSQCRATLEALVAIKNPPVIFARQANIANGHQQINNTVPVTTTKVAPDDTPVA